ncbi:MAG: S46 family peptidase [Saprospiraceae bacterium]|nr:S46 family peptidase [Saprospiraceae bacterium]
MKNVLLLLLFTVSPLLLIANEGMWLPIFLSQLNEKEMRGLGMKIKAKDIWNVKKGSLKDAIVQFGGGCTGEVISAEGLLLTNHHCGYSYIQSHSSVANNYIDNGFWAKKKADELPNAGLTVTFIADMADVTLQILGEIPENIDATTKQSQVDKRINQIIQNYPHESWQEVIVKPFYKGNQYFLFVTETYKDVRFVGAPPSAIGNFGVDTDNWVWPRHTADFSLFRIYADKNNRPAAYSKDNVPFRPKHFLPISIKGIKENDFTMVMGFPGVTNEYLPSYAVAQTMEITDPTRVNIRSKTLAIMLERMKTDTVVKIKYVSKYASISNGWKKWTGEMEGLKKTNAIAKKQAYESDFQTRVIENPTWKIKYENLLPELKSLYEKSNRYTKVRDYVSELLRVNIEAFKMAARMDALVSAYEENGESGFTKKKNEIKDDAVDFFKNYDASIDKEVYKALFEMYSNDLQPSFQSEYVISQIKEKNTIENWANYCFENSSLSTKDKFDALLNLPIVKTINIIKIDPIYLTYKSILNTYNSQVIPFNREVESRITDLQQIYMKAQMEVFSEKQFYPDANSTLRVTYGKVKGYSPRDGVNYNYQTFLDGVLEKYIPDDYEFDVPQKLIALYKNKDYGQYGENGKMPVAFIGSNHTTGGNSGSPSIDARGNLIGLNFDRVWEGTMSDLNYDASICRNIMVDIRYILFIIDKYAGAKNLIQEMKIIK